MLASYDIAPTILALQDIQTDSSKLIDVRMVYFGQESNLRRGHRVVLWKEEFEFENSAYMSNQQEITNTRRGNDLPSYGDDDGPCMRTSKYLRLSSCGIALIPGTLNSSVCIIILKSSHLTAPLPISLSL